MAYQEISDKLNTLILTYPTIPKSLIYTQSPNRTLNLIFFNFNNFGDFNNRLKCLKINSGIGSLVYPKWRKFVVKTSKRCHTKINKSITT
jgi:hypothetical protein